MTGCCGKVTPLCTVAEGCVAIASFAAAPAVPVAVKVTGFPLIPLPAAVAVSVLGPAVVLSVHVVTAAIPPAPVGTGVVGLTLPLPAAGAAARSRGDRERCGGARRGVAELVFHDHRGGRDRRVHGGRLLVARGDGDAPGAPRGAGGREGDRAAGETGRRRRQRVGPGGGGERPAADGGDPGGVGRLARSGDGAVPRRDRERHRHAGDGVAARVLDDDGGRNRHGAARRDRLVVPRVQRDLARRPRGGGGDVELSARRDR